MTNYRIIIFFVFILFFINSCGIENSMYFQEPRNVSAYIKSTINPIPTTGTDSAAIKFYGYNQEKDSGNYVFAGYDVYYYFPGSSTKRRANVLNPVLPSNTKLINFPVSSPVQFPAPYFPESNFYQVITIPVNDSMISNILTQGANDNVRFTFGKDDIIATADYSNPSNGGISGEAGSYVYLGSIFPAYSEYKDRTWGSNDTAFEGFYDIDYYINMGISPVTGNPDGSVDCVYKVFFYIIAKGFNTDYERNQNFVESIPSSVVEVYFLARAASKNH